MISDQLKGTVGKIPILSTQQGPKDPKWIDRLKEEYTALIKYMSVCKEEDNDWFKIESNKEGVKWWGKVWVIVEMVKYEYIIEFEIPVNYPLSPIELALPELDGKTEKMYRGGVICTDIHFAPLWQKNAPKFGIAHSLALGMGPWLAIEIPDLIRQGRITKLT